MKKKIKNILIIGPFPDPISGVSLANKVVKEVFDENTDFITDFINTSYPFFQESVGSFSIKKTFFYVGLNFKIFKIFKNDIIYITPGQTFFGIVKYAVFILLASLLNKELIIHVHGNFIGTQYYNLKGFKKKIFYFLVSKFTKGIVLSPSLKANLIPFLVSEKIFVLNNFAEDYLLKKGNETIINKLQIVFLSNLMLEKGVLDLLEALKELEQKEIPYEAKIAGNIDEGLKPIIIEKIDALKLTSYIGVVRSNNKKELLHWSNIFVLPTYYKMEGQPISIIEAMATGNVIVTTSHAGIPDLIENNINGIIVEKKNPKSINKAFIYLNENKSKILEISKNNKMYFAKNLTIDIFKENLIEIIKK